MSNCVFCYGRSSDEQKVIRNGKTFFRYERLSLPGHGGVCIFSRPSTWSGVCCMMWSHNSRNGETVFPLRARAFIARMVTACSDGVRKGRGTIPHEQLLLIQVMCSILPARSRQRPSVMEKKTFFRYELLSLHSPYEMCAHYH